MDDIFRMDRQHFSWYKEPTCSSGSNAGLLIVQVSREKENTFRHHNSCHCTEYFKNSVLLCLLVFFLAWRGPLSLESPGHGVYPCTFHSMSAPGWLLQLPFHW